MRNFLRYRKTQNSKFCTKLWSYALQMELATMHGTVSRTIQHNKLSRTRGALLKWNNDTAYTTHMHKYYTPFKNLCGELLVQKRDK